MGGSQCPMADVASGALQSPTAWRWTPCMPGLAPITFIRMLTVAPDDVNVTVPVTLLPLFATSGAMACFSLVTSPTVQPTHSTSMATSVALIRFPPDERRKQLSYPSGNDSE